MVRAESEKGKMSKQLYEREFLTQAVPGDGGCSECRHVEEKLDLARRALLYVGDAADTFKLDAEYPFMMSDTLRRLQSYAYATAEDLKR